MEGIFYSVAAVVLVAILVLIVFAIGFVRQAKATAEQVNRVLLQTQDLITRVGEQIPSLVQSIEQLSKQATQTLDNADRRLTVLGETLENFRQVSQRINQLELRLQTKIEGPLMDAARIIAGINRAVKTFADAFNRR